MVRAINVNRRDVAISDSARGGERFEFFIEAAANGGTSAFGQSDGLNLPNLRVSRATGWSRRSLPA